MSAIVGLQRRMMELGRIRLGGEKGEKQPGRKLQHFRLTSASRALLEAAAVEYGGTVTDWQGAPDEGYFQVYTETDVLDIILPPVFSDRDGSPTLPYSQAYELFKGPERVRCCDGVTETISAKPCMCDPEGRDCQIMTRLNVMLPKLPGLGVWLLQSHGWNAASVLPGTLDLLQMAAAEQSFIPALLRLEARTSKKDGTTRKFVVPVIDLPDVRIGELINGGTVAAVNGPMVRPAKPALPPAVAVPVSTLDDGQPEFPDPPSLPTRESGTAAPPVPGTTPESEGPSMATEKQRRLIFAKAKEHGVGEDTLRGIFQEFTGQSSSAAIPAARVDVILAAIEVAQVPV